MSKYYKIRTSDIASYAGNNIKLLMDEYNHKEPITTFEETADYIKVGVKENKTYSKNFFGKVKTEITYEDIFNYDLPVFMIVENIPFKVLSHYKTHEYYLIDVMTKNKIVLKEHYLDGNGLFLNNPQSSSQYDDWRDYYVEEVTEKEAKSILSLWSGEKNKKYLAKWADFIDMAKNNFSKQMNEIEQTVSFNNQILDEIQNSMKSMGKK